ncbi:MAG: nucleotidyl transferase AbiEii/AbiGii toxin family protein [Acidobacteria bacterium]|nr:nucleotidyl transferase AbiEii/AbiGii toxin family protein [Acidobacteriota bacterium]
MSPRQLLNLAASVKQRLLNLAEERGEDFNLLLVRHAVERLLYRLGESEHSGDFVLKGAMLFHLKSVPLPHRPTRDLDLLGRGTTEPRRLEQVLRQVCGVKVELAPRAPEACIAPPRAAGRLAKSPAKSSLHPSGRIDFMASRPAANPLR